MTIKKTDRSIWSVSLVLKVKKETEYRDLQYNGTTWFWYGDNTTWWRHIYGHLSMSIALPTRTTHPHTHSSKMRKAMVKPPHKSNFLLRTPIQIIIDCMPITWLKTWNQYIHTDLHKIYNNYPYPKNEVSGPLVERYAILLVL